jgi:hypothetical protein
MKVNSNDNSEFYIKNTRRIREAEMLLLLRRPLRMPERSAHSIKSGNRHLERGAGRNVGLLGEGNHTSEKS